MLAARTRSFPRAGVLLALGAALAALPLLSAVAQEPSGNSRPGKQTDRVPARTAILRERVQTRLEAARALVTKLEEAQRLVERAGDNRNADWQEVERTLDQANRLARQAASWPQGAGQRAGESGPEPSAIPGLEPLGAMPSGKALEGEELAKALALFQDVAPDALAALRERTRNRENMLNRMVSVVTPRLKAIAALREQPGQGGALMTLRTEELARTLDLLHAARMMTEPARGSEGGDEAAEKRARQRALREALGHNFDVRMRIQSHQIDELATRTDRMRGELRTLSSQREKMLDEKTAALVRSTTRATKENSGGKSAGDGLPSNDRR
ncbi:MAG: hypothetical protein ACT4PL_14375 [Phycisphaerales bacterium]